jgi:hypothetical protein
VLDFVRIGAPASRTFIVPEAAQRVRVFECKSNSLLQVLTIIVLP